MLRMWLLLLGCTGDSVLTEFLSQHHGHKTQQLTKVLRLETSEFTKGVSC